MTRTILLAIALAAPAATAQQVAGPGVGRTSAPVSTPGQVAKRAPVNGVLVLYGNERCPTDADGNEVIVCQRRSASEQFRVPKELREFEVTPENAAWAAKAQGTLAAGDGANAIGSCSAVGPGGQTGCFGQLARANRAENKARQEAAARVP
jgi:hypothetical protein